MTLASQEQSVQNQAQCQALVSTFTETVDCSKLDMKLKYAIWQRTQDTTQTYCERVFSFTDPNEINATARDEYQIQQCLKMELSKRDMTVVRIMELLKVGAALIIVLLLSIVSVVAFKRFLK